MDCASRTAPCALRPGRKPWLCSLEVGSRSGCSTCSSACWIKRSVTVGMPSSRSPPSGFGSSPVAPASAGTFPPEPVRGCQATPCADEPRSPRWTDRPHQPRPCWPSPVSKLFAGSRAPGPLPAAPALCSARHSAGRSLHRCPVQTGLHPVSPRTAPLSRASDAWLPASLCLKHSSSFGPSPRIRLLRPLLTSRSGSTPSPFQAQGEISPGKNAFLHRTTAGSTPPPLGHESFAVHGPLALVGTASYPVLVHRHAVYAPRFLPTLGHPHAVALHFTRCDQLVAGLPPAGMRPCRAHHGKNPDSCQGSSSVAQIPSRKTRRKTPLFQLDLACKSRKRWAQRPAASEAAAGMAKLGAKGPRRRSA